MSEKFSKLFAQVDIVNGMNKTKNLSYGRLFLGS